MHVQLGNVAGREGVTNDSGETVYHNLDDSAPRVTYVHIPDEYSLAEAFQVVTNPGGAWEHHSTQGPSWVYSDNSAFEALLADHYDCPAGLPEDVHETHHTNSGGPGAASAALEAAAAEEAPAKKKV